jgi:uncharacterized protein
MPSAERPVVADTSPIIALAGIERLALLRALYSQVLIPEGVYSELVRGGYRTGSYEDLTSSPWIQVRPIRKPAPSGLVKDIGRGEAEALALAREIDARVVLIDDQLGRRRAAHFGIKVTGTVGILIAAHRAGLEPRIEPLLDRLEANGIYISPRIRESSRRMVSEV